MMPVRTTAMSRSNARSRAGRRKPDGGRIMNRLLLNDSVQRRGRTGKKLGLRQEFVDEADYLEDGLSDMDALLDKQAGRDTQDIEILRKTEMLFEE